MNIKALDEVKNEVKKDIKKDYLKTWFIAFFVFVVFRKMLPNMFLDMILNKNTDTGRTVIVAAFYGIAVVVRRELTRRFI